MADMNFESDSDELNENDNFRGIRGTFEARFPRPNGSRPHFPGQRFPPMMRGGQRPPFPSPYSRQESPTQRMMHWGPDNNKRPFMDHPGGFRPPHSPLRPQNNPRFDFRPQNRDFFERNIQDRPNFHQERPNYHMERPNFNQERPGFHQERPNFIQNRFPSPKDNYRIGGNNARPPFNRFTSNFQSKPLDINEKFDENEDKHGFLASDEEEEMVEKEDTRSKENVEEDDGKIKDTEHDEFDLDEQLNAERLKADKSKSLDEGESENKVDDSITQSSKISEGQTQLNLDSNINMEKRNDSPSFSRVNNSSFERPKMSPIYDRPRLDFQPRFERPNGPRMDFHRFERPRMDFQQRFDRPRMDQGHNFERPNLPRMDYHPGYIRPNMPRMDQQAFNRHGGPRMDHPHSFERPNLDRSQAYDRTRLDHPHDLQMYNRPNAPRMDYSNPYDNSIRPQLERPNVFERPGGPRLERPPMFESTSTPRMDRPPIFDRINGTQGYDRTSAPPPFPIPGTQERLNIPPPFEHSTIPSKLERPNIPPMDQSPLMPNLQRPGHYPVNRLPPPIFPGMPPMSVTMNQPPMSQALSTMSTNNSSITSTAPFQGIPSMPPVQTRPNMPPFFDPRLRYMTHPPMPGHFPPPFGHMPPPHMLQAPPLPVQIDSSNSNEKTLTLATLNEEEVWVQNPTSDGRSYYYNWKTRVTNWEKPQGVRVISQTELNNLLANKTPSTISSGPIQVTNEAVQPQKPAEVAEWNEYKAPDGRPYFHNRRTALTTWDKPQIIIDWENESSGIKPSIDTAQTVEKINVKNKDDEENNNKNIKDESSEESNDDEDDEEENADSSKSRDKSKPISSTPVSGTPWCIVWTGDGRVFFFNPAKRTSVWERPEELKGRTDVDKILEEPPKELSEKNSDKMNEESKSNEPPAKKQKLELEKEASDEISDEVEEVEEVMDTSRNEQEEMPVTEVVPLSKEAAKEAEEKAAKERALLPVEVRMVQFREMLIEKQVSAFSTWEKELHKIVFDPRYLLLASRERKSAFENYVKDRAEEERREKKNQVREKKDQFKKLLKEANLTSKSTYSDFANKYSKDERFKLTEKTRDKEVMFQDFISELRKKDKDDKHKDKDKKVMKQNKDVVTFSSFKNKGHRR